MQNNTPSATPIQALYVLGSDFLMNRRDAALYLGVAEQTLATWACTGRYSLPVLRVGRLVRYRKSDLDAWLASRTAGTDAE